MEMRSFVMAMACLALASARAGDTVVDVTMSGAEKFSVQIDVADQNYAKCLKRNLERSGRFVVQSGGAITVSGTPGTAVVARGKGKELKATDPAGDAAEVRQAARRMSDAICEAFGGQKGFASDRIAFVADIAPGVKELCTCYPDGYDVRQVTSDNNIVVGPRWKDADTLLYTRYINAGPEIWQMDVNTGKRERVLKLGGLNTGAVVSPDGRKVAVILSIHGNPELYVIDLAAKKWDRLTFTKSVEGQPSWSPDGKKIVYVSDETRQQHLYVIDVASKKSRRITKKGKQNVDPDWGSDGRIAYVTKRGRQKQIAVIEPAAGDDQTQLVTSEGAWEHPSWARDGRHVTACRDKAIFSVDTLEDGDKPVPVFVSSGKWITPSWSR